MRATAPAAFAARYAYEWLWDCKPETRAIACQAVPLTHLDAAAWLRALAADPLEEDTVRDAAATRLRRTE